MVLRSATISPRCIPERPQPRGFRNLLHLLQTEQAAVLGQRQYVLRTPPAVAHDAEPVGEQEDTDGLTSSGWSMTSAGPTIIHVYQPTLGLKGILVVDNVATGPSIGGLRMAPDVSVEEMRAPWRAP